MKNFEMEPRMAAAVWNAAILLLFLLPFLFVSYYRFYQRRTTVHEATHRTILFRFFYYSDALLDVSVGGAAVLVKRVLKMEVRRCAG